MKKFKYFLTLLSSLILVLAGSLSINVSIVQAAQAACEFDTSAASTRYQHVNDWKAVEDGYQRTKVAQWNIPAGKKLWCGNVLQGHPDNPNHKYMYYEPQESGKSMVRKIMYYGYDGPQAQAQFTANASRGIVLTSLLCSKAYSGQTLHGIEGCENVSAEVDTLYNQLGSLPEPPANFKVYVIRSDETANCWATGQGGVQIQQLVCWVIEDTPQPPQSSTPVTSSTTEEEPCEAIDQTHYTGTDSGRTSVTVDFDYIKKDKKTNDYLTGGKFHVMIKNGANDGRWTDMGILEAENGHIRGSKTFNSPEFTGSSTEYYARNYYDLCPEDQARTQSQSSAISAADSEARRQVRRKISDFENARREVKITEVEAPTSYLLDHPEVTKELENSGSGTLYNWGSEEMEVYKVDNQGNRLHGASFKMERAIDHKLMWKWISSQQGDVKDGLVQNTKYLVTEVKVPKGYVTPTKKTYEITTGPIGTQNTLTIKNAKVTFTKKDATGANEVEGAKMVVKEANTGRVVDTWYSTKQAHLIENLVEGVQYILTEEIAPGGYNIASSIEFTPTTQDIHLEMKDTIDRAIKKQANGSYHAGAVLQALVQKDGANRTATSQGDPNNKAMDDAYRDYEVRDEWTTCATLVNGYTGGNTVSTSALAEGVTRYNRGRTVKSASIEAGFATNEVTLKVGYTDGSYDYYDMDKKGKETYHRIRNLNTNEDYVIFEQKAPAGYTRANPLNARTADNKDNQKTMVDTKVTFTKVDAGGDEVVGAHMTVYDEGGNKVDEWISTDKSYQISNLVQGKKYRIHEEITPDGYVWAHDIWFTVSTEKDQEFKMIDTIYNVKKVDDSGNFVYGAYMQAVDKETGDVIDEWQTGQNLVKLTDAQKQTLNSNQPLTFTANGTEYKFTPRTVPNPDNKEGEAYNKPAFTLRMKKGDLYSYYEADSNGDELGHQISHAKADKEYIIKEAGTPKGYTKANDEGITTSATKDQQLVVIDTIYTVKKVDQNNDFVYGARMQAIDKETNEVIDEWETGKNIVELTDDQKATLDENRPLEFKKDGVEYKFTPYSAPNPENKTGEAFEKPVFELRIIKVEDGKRMYYYYEADRNGDELGHRISNTIAGKEYIVKESYTPDGFVHANDEGITTDKVKDQQIIIIDTIQVVIKTDDDGRRVYGATMQAIDKETGKAVDEWVTGANLVELTEEQTEALKTDKKLTFETEDGARYRFTGIEDEKAENPEEPSTEETTEVVDNPALASGEDEVVEQVEEENTESTEETETTEKKTVREDKSVPKPDTEIAEVEELPYMTFLLQQVRNNEDGTREFNYYIVDEYGNEIGHRVSHLNARSGYTISETITPDGYVRANDKDIIAPDVNDALLEVVDTQYKLKKHDEHSNYVEGATMQAIDKETGEVVDEWVTNGNIINLTKDQTRKLENGEKLTIDKDGYRYIFTPKEAGMIEELIEQPESPEEPADSETPSTEPDDSTAPTDPTTSTEAGESTENNDPTLVDQIINTITMKKKYTQFGLQVFKIPTEPVDEPENPEEPTPENPEDTTVETSKPAEDTTEPDGEGVVVDTDNPENPDETEPEEPVEYAGILNISRTKKVPNDFAYYEVDSRGNELEHRIRHIEANKVYIIREAKTPKDYVRASDEEIIAPADKDAVIIIIDKQVRFTKEDINGEEVPGAKITVKDAEGNKVDEWISKTEPHYINNLEVGKTYTLIEEITPNGYVQANALEFEMTKDGLDAHYKMVDTIHRIIKVDDMGLPVKDARLAVYDKDGKKVDEWITGQHILDIPEKCFEEIEAEGISRIEPEEVIPEVSKETIDEVKDEMDKALRFLYPNLDYVEGEDDPATESSESTESSEEVETDEPVALADADLDDLEHPEVVPGQVDENGEPIEEVTMTKEDYLKAGFEKLALTSEELDNKVVIASQLLDKATDEQHAEDIRKELYDFVDQTVEEVNAKIEEQNHSVVGVYIYKNEQSAGGYTVRYVEKNGSMRYIDIDEHGDEANHRVSGMTVGETYTLKELKSPFGFNLAPEMEFTAEGSTDIKVTMIDMPLLLMSTRKTGANGAELYIYLGAGVLVILIGAGIFAVIKKRKNNK